MSEKKSMEEAKLEEMQDQHKGGENQVKKMKEEQQRKIDKESPEAPDKYPEAPGNPEEKDVPRGT